ncbi:glycosyltransferase, partial [Pseudomonadales bacterium]|nr:glycosyltransferase [Pseudomonadales bacterium]
GEVEPGKGQHHLVRAFAEVHKRFPETSLVIVGDGPLSSVVESEIRKLGLEASVKMLGRRTDIKECLSCMDVYALPSISGEFFPNSILEAMSTGIPWVGCDIAGLKELTAGGEAGEVVSIGDIDALVLIMSRLVEDTDLRMRMGLNAREEVEKKFSIQQVFSRVLASYGRVIAS